MTDMLTPPDTSRCQAEKPNGAGPFTLGGRPGLVRCTNKPQFIVTENEPGEDGLKGSMSLCAHCLTVFLKQMPDGFATVEEL